MGNDHLRISVTPETCAGTGVCTFYAAKTFELDEAGKASIVADDGDTAEDLRNAAEACPTRSIRLAPAG